MFRYFLQKHTKLIIIFFIILICSIAIAVGIYAQITDTHIISGSTDENNPQNSDYADLKINFDSIFNNTVNIENSAKFYSNISNTDDIIYKAYFIDKSETGKYSLKGDIPMFKVETETTKKINQEIYTTFVDKLINIMKTSSSNVVCTISYVGYINNNIASLAIRCTLKEGTSPQRLIIKTYNYNIEEDKLLSLQNILSLKKLDNDSVQKNINNEIKYQIEKDSSITLEGYNVYKRDLSNDMYKIENTSTYFLGRNNYLYIVYAYGNNTFTSTKDLIIY